MTDLAETVEAILSNMDRLSDEALAQIKWKADRQWMLRDAKISKKRLNEILDKIDIKRPHEMIMEKDFNLGVRAAISAIRGEVEKIV